MESLYVCLFDNGHIKVGRSVDPQSRIAAHADRVACMGVELADHFVVACAGSAVPAETDLIALCAGSPGSKRFQSEWFAGLEYELVCEWAKVCAEKVYEESPVTPLRAYLDSLPLGGISDFARRVGINKMYLTQLAAGFRGREPGPALCVRMEQESGGKLSRLSLRADAHAIWPDLDDYR